MTAFATLATFTAVTREQVEDLLYLEAELLDSWQLEQWLALYTDDATYCVPSAALPRDASPENTLFYIADDRTRLQERVIRLMKKGAHSEYPRSRTCHLVSNVRLGASEDAELQVSAAFVVYRSKNGHTDTFIGRSRYRLRQVDGALKIVDKRCDLDLENLRPQGRVSIIL